MRLHPIYTNEFKAKAVARYAMDYPRLTQREIAKSVGVYVQTLREWVNAASKIGEAVKPVDMPVTPANDDNAEVARLRAELAFANGQIAVYEKMFARRA